MIPHQVLNYNSIVITDLDECDKETYYCDKSSSCSNTQGSYKCACNQGHVGDGFACYKYTSKYFFNKMVVSNFIISKEQREQRYESPSKT